MRGLASFQKAQDVNNRGLNRCVVAVKSAAVLILLSCILACLLIPLNSVAESAALPRPEIVAEHVNVNAVGVGAERGGASTLLDEWRPNAVGDVVKFFSLVPSDGLPVSDQKTSQECGGTESKCGVLRMIFYVLENHGISMLFWGLIGYVCGGGFGRPPFQRETEQKRNAERD